jgi:hypothetical protein
MAIGRPWPTQHGLSATAPRGIRRERREPAFRGMPIGDAVSADGSSFELRGSLVIVRDPLPEAETDI